MGKPIIMSGITIGTKGDKTHVMHIPLTLRPVWVSTSYGQAMLDQQVDNIRTRLINHLSSKFTTNGDKNPRKFIKGVDADPVSVTQRYDNGLVIEVRLRDEKEAYSVMGLFTNERNKIVFEEIADEVEYNHTLTRDQAVRGDEPLWHSPVAVSFCEMKYNKTGHPLVTFELRADPRYKGRASLKLNLEKMTKKILVSGEFSGRMMEHAQRGNMVQFLIKCPDPETKAAYMAEVETALMKVMGRTEHVHTWEEWCSGPVTQDERNNQGRNL